jgi:ABC-2 type transport system permease protein
MSMLNPLTYVVDAERALFDGRFEAATLVPGLLAAAVVAVLGLTVGMRAMRRSS